MNTNLENKQKMILKDFLKLMNNSVFGKTLRNVRKHRDIKLITTANRRNQLVSEPNYHAIKDFLENLVGTEMKKKQKKNKSKNE